MSCLEWTEWSNNNIIVVMRIKSEDRLRFGRKNKQVHFIFLSACTIFAQNFAIMSIEQQLFEDIKSGIKHLYGVETTDDQLQLQKTKKEFQGHLTLVTFPLSRISNKKPEQTGEDIGNYLKEQSSVVADFNILKGFLNLTIAGACWVQLLNELNVQPNYGIRTATTQSPLVMIEYSSPNTNKPLHLGHIRNNLLGFSLAEIMKANGNNVVKTNIVNDRGIHICKSMLAWQKWGEGATPESSGKKGDHLVGDFYVLFDKHYKEELKALEATGLSKEEAEAHSTLMADAREMLRRWESGDSDVVTLWKTMNSWVYEGFDETYKKMGVDFDKIYYESETYLEGKQTVLDGLEKKVFYRREDGSVWADLTGEGLDEKLLLRSDGTSVYMTQDIGTAKLRFDDYSINKIVYVVGNEQNYHFQVLSILLDKLGFAFGKGLVHFSYGMVELPEGKMKSREGTVVDADDLMEEMIGTAREISNELGKLDKLSTEEADKIIRMIGLGSLKYFILKVDPRKNMVFNPKESIDFNGNTGPFIQYTHARICSVLRKAKDQGLEISALLDVSTPVNQKEEALIQRLAEYADIVKEAGDTFSPACIANYIYDLVKEFNQFYHDYSILSETNEAIRQMRLMLSANTAKIIRSGMALLGIEVPDRM